MKVMMINSLDGVRVRRGLASLAEQYDIARGEADELIGTLTEAAEAGRIDSETYSSLQARYDAFRLRTSTSGSWVNDAEGVAWLEEVRVWTREVRRALGIGTAMIALGIGAAVLLFGGAAVWYVRRKKR